MEFNSNEREKEIKDLIKNILTLKRIILNENMFESQEKKLKKRLLQRSYPKLSEKIAFYLIERYEIDNNKLPSKEILIQMMIDFLGNIQKNPSFYKLTNNKYETAINCCNKIGQGSKGIIYSYKLKKDVQTNKSSKRLALKFQKSGDPFTIDIHITSAILLALYGFQPKYYNNIFMEIGAYENKSIQRLFHSIKTVYYKKSNIENNIKWFILYNFTNIRDQRLNYMERILDKQLLKIDFKHLNSESIANNIIYIFVFFDKYEKIFIRNKEMIIKELNKILNIKEDFILDLIVFRTMRGGYTIKNKHLLKEIYCLSSCYKIIEVKGKTSFMDILNQSKSYFKKGHLEFNPALTWMIYIFYQKNILNEQEYNEYINKFNEMAEKYEHIAQDIEFRFKEGIEYYEIKYDEIDKNYEYENESKEKDKIELTQIKNKTKNKNKNKINNFSKEITVYLNSNTTNDIQPISMEKNPEFLDEKNLIIENDEKIHLITEGEKKNFYKSGINGKKENNLINNYEDIKMDNKKIKNKKSKSSFFFWCCGEEAADAK